MPTSSPAAGRETRGLERAGQPLLALRLRDHLAGVPAAPARCRGRLPGGLRPHLRAPRRAARRRGGAALDRTLTRRLCVDRLRARRPRAADRGAARSSSAEDGSLSSTRRWRCTRRCATLPEHCAEILDRFFARDESYRTIGEALDLPPGRSPAASRAASPSCASNSREESRGSSRQWIDEDEHSYDEERLAELLRTLPPAPAGVGAGGAGAPAARREMDEIVARAEADQRVPGGGHRGSRGGARGRRIRGRPSLTAGAAGAPRVGSSGSAPGAGSLRRASRREAALARFRRVAAPRAAPIDSSWGRAGSAVR